MSKLVRRVLAGDAGPAVELPPPRLSRARARRESSPKVAAKKARLCRSASASSACSKADLSRNDMAWMRCSDDAADAIGPSSGRLPNLKVWSITAVSSTLPRVEANVGLNGVGWGPVHAP